jgi:GNAT superfamily N-acetyltransferase
LASLYAEYLSERTNDKILEMDFGFATYRHMPDQKTTYIVDIYIKPEHRKQGFAALLADQISQEAKDIGHSKIIGTVVPSAKGSNDSLKVLLGYKMKLQSSGPDWIVFEKEL